MFEFVGSVPQNMAFTSVTHDVKVSVIPSYLEYQSTPDNHQYVWAYQVSIENGTGHEIRLVNRYWRITDAAGRVQEVRGPGVIGVQPSIKPDEVFQYTSGTSLNTTSGIMSGHYEMLSLDTNKIFLVEIPAFSLDLPYDKTKAH